MTSQHPPTDERRPRFRQAIRQFTGALVGGRGLRPSPQHLAPPDSRLESESRSQPTTPLSSPSASPINLEHTTNPSPASPTTPVPVSTSAATRGSHQGLSRATWAPLLNSLNALRISTNLFPHLKSAVNAFIRCLDIVEAATLNDNDYGQLADEFKSMADILDKHAEELGDEMGSGSIANIARSIREQADDIKNREERGGLGRRIIEASQDRDDVIRSYRQIEKLFRQLQSNITIGTRGDVKKQFETILLRGMFPVYDAKYNSSYSTSIRRHGCTAQTRERIQKDIQEWATDPAGAKIYWLSGMAGTGKTTIAYSLCQWLEDTSRLGASFFCSRIPSACHSLREVVPTLAYQLARYSPVFRSELCAMLKDDPDAATLNVTPQFEKLLYLPVLAAGNAIPDGVVVVIDALDECEDGYSVRLFLDVLLGFAAHLPLKFFVASRPEHIIRDRMLSQEGAPRSILQLHDIEESIVEGDIKKYLTDALQSMSPPPSPEQIELLTKRSGKLFIYAATVIRYIHPRDIPVNSRDRLKAMLAAARTLETDADNAYQDLDRLYTSVLTTAFDKRLGEKERVNMQRVLWTIPK
ncbi:hypothetical protein FRC11_008913 [Ceratobasidium sp. 423]|nr:hypothetical protein FRC11_008913 [Ceratobasidium sp. 423]